MSGASVLATPNCGVSHRVMHGFSGRRRHSLGFCILVGALLPFARLVRLVPCVAAVCIDVSASADTGWSMNLSTVGFCRPGDDTFSTR